MSVQSLPRKADRADLDAAAATAAAAAATAEAAAGRDARRACDAVRAELEAAVREAAKVPARPDARPARSLCVYSLQPAYIRDYIQITSIFAAACGYLRMVCAYL
jgi:hypothetical protein